MKIVKIYGGTAVDIELLTDLIGSNDSCTVYQAKGLDDIEISFGFDLTKQETTLTALKAFCVEKGLNMDIYEDRQPVINAVSDFVPLAFTTESLANATNGVPYEATVAAEGGNGAYTFETAGLPTGLSLSTAGVISGTPNDDAGSFTVEITVTDFFGVNVTEEFTLVLAD